MATKPVVLIVDDEAGVRESVRMVLKDAYEPVAVASGEAALEFLGGRSCDLIFLDVLMPGIDGLETLERIRARDTRVAVVMLTATKTVKTAVTAMKLGAFDYLTKPFDIEELRLVAERATENARLKQEVEVLREAVGQRYSFSNIVGQSEPMQKVFKTVAAVAPMKSTVLITGESGTGKELIARALHYHSPRASRPLVTLNCAAIPDNLLESELFGHERGSFTDAVDKKVGQFELAHTGTIFLDEIGEMSAGLQAKLLRVLEEGEIQRVGAPRPMKVDVRVVAATNRNLIENIAAGRFRKDLYFRLNVVTVELPPLRARRDDIPHLIAYFLTRKSRELGIPRKELAAATADRMLQHSWPGNVRELENVIERMLVLSGDSPVLTTEHLPSDMGMELTGDGNRDTALQVLSGLKTLSDAVDEFEREIIAQALSQTFYNQTRAAELLGTTRRILKYRMDKLGLDCPDSAPPAARIGA
ncbi:MAG TPA: sigma-54 dependent transcriptional regulator [Candidatus Limnocylindrales bacterium]|nr:sigma-54 dependent transcriptional regulator [Candidatus Limnocylindrales bacterium]